jgi:sugar phosphate permease
MKQVLQCNILSVRWRISVILAVTLFFNFLTRNSIALILPSLAQDFGWSNRQIGANGELLLGVFYISYGLANMMLSPLAERFSPKRSLVLALVLFSGLTSLCGVLGTSLAVLIGLRLLLGLAQGVHIPMMSAIVAQWFPRHERSKANTIWNLGCLVEIAVSPLIVVALTNQLGWRATFVLLGLSSLIIGASLVQWFVQDTPRHYPSISVAELDYISGGNGGGNRGGNGGGLGNSKTPSSASKTSKTDRAVSWRAILRDCRFWLMVLGGSLNNFVAFGILGWLPTYFNRAKGIDLEALGWPLAVVFMMSIWGTVLMAVVGDRWGKRALMAGIGCGMVGVMVYIATTMQDLNWLVFFFACGVFCDGGFLAHEYAMIQRLLPAAKVGAGTGLYNGLAVLFGGVTGSFIPGTIVSMTGDFDLGMLSVVVGAGLAALVMVTLSRLFQY